MQFKQYTKDVEINGTMRQVTFTVEVEEDHYDLTDQDYETDAQREEHAALIISGQVFAATIQVTAECDDVEGIDSLGGCELVANNLFNSEPFNASVERYLSDYGLESMATYSLVAEFEREEKKAADARLLAVAPELVSALKDVLYAANNPNSVTPAYLLQVLSSAHSTVAKAEGGAK